MDRMTTDILIGMALIFGASLGIPFLVSLLVHAL